MKFLERLDGKRICVAVSGGADSVALLHYMKAQSSHYGFSLSAVHCQHGIRGQASLDDKAFVIKLCNEWNISLFLFDEDCPMRAKDKKESLETTARNFRRESFLGLIKEDKADYIATAHHLGDEAETVLLHLARGAGLSGARGIQPQSEFYIRPFLAWSKEQILAYIGEHGLSYRTDESNFCLDATRNKIRLQVLPLLEEIIPSAKENIAKFAQKALEDDTFLYALSDKLITRQGNAYLLSFHDEKPLFYRATLSILKSLGLTQDYTTKHLESAYALQYLERGAKAHLPKNIRLEKTEKGILFTMQTEEPTILPNNTEKPFTLDGFDGGRYAVKIETAVAQESANGWRVLRFDKDKLPKDAVFRFRKDGDEIEKFGGGTKSLKKFFNERKILVRERSYLPLIASSTTGEVYAVCGVEIADKIKTTEDTKSVLYIVLQKEKGL
ncbi:MAG: tRNA lysidine(34) synthetase TilS [Clostridia bacterium]|nr:tRNA lysidine(34) synthetase TilS [Clostridia bacterium]